MRPPFEHTSTTGWRPARPKAWAGTHGGSLSHLAMGIFLTLLGVVLSLDRLQLFDAAQALRWWPVGFHVLGATILLRRSDSHGRFWGLAWLGIGTWLLLSSLGIVRIGLWDLIWPLFLMFVGVRLILRARTTTPNGTDAPTGTPNLMAVLSEAKGSVHEVLIGASLTSVMGGCTLDLRQATIRRGDEPVVDVFTTLGGLEIAVPAGWTVVLDVASILAAAEDKRLPTVGGPADGAQAPRIIVRGTLLLGGLTITN